MQERIDDHEARIKRLEQHTEPITIPRIELDPGGIQNRLDNQAEILREQEKNLTLIFTDIGHMKTDIGLLKGGVNTLKTDMEGVKADVLKIRESQADFKDTLKTMVTKNELRTELTAMESRINGNIATMKEDLLTAIKQLLQQRPSE